MNTISTVSNKDSLKKAIRLPFWVTLLASLTVIAAFFLPLATANEEYKEYLEKYAQELNMPEIKMTNEDAIHISMYEFAKTFWVVYSLIDTELAIVVTTIIGATGTLSLITLLFILAKKPIAIAIFNSLTLGAYYLITWDCKSLGVIPSIQYHWGIAYYIYFIGITVLFVGAIWMLVKKIQLKHKKKSAVEEQ